MNNGIVNNIKKYWKYFIIPAAPVLLFFLFQSYIQFPIDDLGFMNGLFSVLWMEALCLAAVLLSGRPKIALIVISVPFILLGIAENYIYRFRTSFLTPIDFFSAGTAANVAANYDFTPPPELILLFILSVVFLLLIILFCPSKLDIPGVKDIRIRLASGFIMLVIFFAMTQYVRNYDANGGGMLDISDNAFHSYKNNSEEGAVLRLLYDSGYLTVKKPQGYSKAAAEELLKEYGKKTEESIPSKEELPDIVVVMNESFSDPHEVGPLETNEDYMPFIHSLQEGHENTVTGILNVSVQGGNTPNTEFEFLTGNTMAFLPEGSIPFQQYLTRDVYSLPRYLSELGYETVAMHPYLSNGWNRTRAYPALGFSDMKFLPYFEEMDPEYVREYVSDSFFSSAISEEVNKRNTDGPVFSFNVTMQNHASYSGEYDNLRKDIKVLGQDDVTHKDELETYLSLVKLSDESFREMVEYYEKTDRKTLLLFFGDHQPAKVNFEAVFHNLGTNRRELTDEIQWDTYKVPFVIWANYDIEEKKDLETSVNYLGNLLLYEAGIPLDPYRAFTADFAEKIPVISAVRTVDSSGKSENLKETEADLSEYERLQYYELFDREVKE